LTQFAGVSINPHPYKKALLSKAEHFCQFRGACKNCSSELFFWSFERVILIFSAIFWYCMITRQLIVKKKFGLTTPKIAKKNSEEQFLQAPRNWQKCLALEDAAVCSSREHWVEGRRQKI
jgi:hypothetical protein